MTAQDGNKCSANEQVTITNMHAVQRYNDQNSIIIWSENLLEIPTVTHQESLSATTVSKIQSNVM